MENKLTNKRYINSFDSLKGLAVFFAVIIGHYWQFTPAEYAADGDVEFLVNFTNKLNEFAHYRSYSFMELLFLISGFQLFASYLRLEEGSLSTVDFIKKRICRLFPLTVISTCYMYIMCVWYGGLFDGALWYNTHYGFSSFFLSIFNIQSWILYSRHLNGPLWYVSIYFLCLIIFPLLIRLGKKLNIGIYAMTIPPLLSLYISITGTNKFLLNTETARGYFAFFLGVIAAYIFNKLSKKQVYIYSLVAIAIYAVFFFGFKERIYSTTRLDEVYTATFLFYIPLLMLLSTNVTLDKIVGNKVLAGLGKIAYSLYVWNFPTYITLAVIEKAFRIEIFYSKFYMWWFFIALQIGIAVLSYKFIEKPVYKKLSKFTESKTETN